MTQKLKIILLVILLVGCQKPAAQAPVYNFTFTDQSSVIVGDNNKPIIAPDAESEQRAESVATAEAKKVTPKTWILFLILGLISCGSVYYAWRRGGY